MTSTSILGGMTEVSTNDDVTMATDNETTTSQEGMDRVFIIAMTCFGVGVLLVIIAFIFTVLWCKKTSRNQQIQKQLHRSQIHTKYLTDYSVKTGGAPNQYTPTGSQRSATNSTDTLGNYKPKNTSYDNMATWGMGETNSMGSAKVSSANGHIPAGDSKPENNKETNGDLIADVMF